MPQRPVTTHATPTLERPVSRPLAPARPRVRGRLDLRRRFKAIPRPLLALLLVGAIQAVAWSVATAPLQGPDENNHVAYVQHVAETGYKPGQRSGRRAYSWELDTAQIHFGLRPLQGSRNARPAWSKVDERQWNKVEKTFTREQRANGDGPNAVAQNPPLYYYLQAVPYRVGLLFGGDIFTRMSLMRLTNGLMYLGTIVFAWLLAGEVLRRRRWLQTIAAGAVAVHPQLAFMSGVINPDTLLVTLFTAAMWLAVRIVRRGPTLGQTAALGAIAAAGFLTHGRGLAIVPAAAFALGLAWWRHRPPRREALRLGGAFAGTIFAGGILLYLLAVAGSDTGAYGGEVQRATTSNSTALNPREFFSLVWQFYLPKLAFMSEALGPDYGYRDVYIETFFGTFGSLEIQWRPIMYDLLQFGVIVGLVAFWTSLVVARDRVWRSWPILLVLVGFFVAELALLHMNSYRQLLTNPNDPIIVGRYLLPLIGLFGLAIAVTVGAMPRRLGPLAGAAVLGLGVFMSISGMALSVARFYG